MDDIVLVSNTDIKKHRNNLKGKQRHNPEMSNTHRVMNMNKYDVFLPKGTHLTHTAYNGLKESKRKSKRVEGGRGKWVKK